MPTLRPLLAVIPALLGLVSCECTTVSQPSIESATPPLTYLRVLFIGNSFTGVNNVPGMIGEIARANGQLLSVATHTPGGRTLQQHLEEGRAVELINQGGWDVVVLQDQSGRPASNPAGTVADAHKLAELIEQSSPRARKVLFNTWAFPVRSGSMAQFQHRLNQGYCAAARAIGGQVAPVGEVWQRVLKERSELEFYSVGDGRHASPLGSYLAAVVLHATLFRRLATQLPGEFRLPDRPSEEPGARPLTLRIRAQDRDLIGAQAAAVLAQPPECPSTTSSGT